MNVKPYALSHIGSPYCRTLYAVVSETTLFETLRKTPVSAQVYAGMGVAKPVSESTF